MSAELRVLLGDAFRRAVASIDFAALVRDALPPLPPRGARVTVVAVGKGAPAMARGAFALWQHRIERALIVTSDDTGVHGLPPSVEIRFSGHPLPDARSVDAAERALDMVRGGARDLTLALVSGGASALFEAPPLGLSLTELRDVVGELVLSGVSISAINTVRRHLSRVKGGRLALAAYPGRTLTLYASDVQAGEAHDVGSGPTVPDPTITDEARGVLERVLGPDRTRALLPYLSESMKPGTPPAVRTRIQLVASPALFSARIASLLGDAGFQVGVLPEATRDARDLVTDYAERARALAPGEAMVAPCEPLLTVGPDAGRGGRAGWLALSLLPHLPPDVAFLAGASDGVDGSSRSAGACVSGDLICPPEVRAAALERFDDAAVHQDLGTALDSGPTGINLTDVQILARKMR
jgi:glycerate 2-kinase